MRIWQLHVLMLLGLLVGCLGAGGFTPVRYYSIDTAPADVPQALHTLPIPLGVQRFTAATRYRDRMLYRLSEVEVSFYEYDRWVEPPEEMVTRVIAETVRASRRFRQVIPAKNIQLPAWLLSGTLTRFDEVRGRASSQAECWLRLELRRARDEQLLWSNVLRAAVPLSTQTPEALAQAMHLAVQQIALQFITELQDADLPPPR